MPTGKRLEDEGAAGKGAFLRHLNLGYAKHVKVSPNPSDEAMEDLLRMNISRDVIDVFCDSVEMECMNCVIHGISMKNQNGGLEIFSAKYFKSPITYGKKGLTYVNGKTASKRNEDDELHLILFADYIDFLSYKTLHDLLFREIPESNDTLILNEVSNLSEMLSKLGAYDHLHLLLPLSIAGRTLSKTIEELHKSSAINHSKKYYCCQRLSDFIRHKETLLNPSKIRL